MGAGSAGSAAPTAKTACSLLSAAEVAAVVGNAVKDGVDEGIRDCKYDAVDPPDWDPSKPIPAIFSAHLFYAHDDSVRTCANLLPTKPGNPAGAIAPIAGLGDQAMWEWNPAMGWDGTVMVCKGKDVFAVSLVCLGCKGAKEADHRAKVEGLAKTVLGRI